MDKILVIVDLGHFKAYGISGTPTGNRIDLIASYDSTESHMKFTEKYSDADGRFAGAGKNVSASGNGEPHNTALEIEKRAIKQISSDINSLLTKKAGSSWFLAASKKINGQIVENLDPAVRGRMEKNVASDLTKIPKAELMKHFA